MWFKFPEGTDRVTIERQTFGIEATDKDGRYFRAPDHFAQIIASLGGFSMSGPPEGTKLEDLPKISPQHDSADQIQKLQELENQVQNLRTDLSATRASLSATLAERDDLKVELHETKVRVADLEDENKELLDAVPKKR